LGAVRIGLDRHLRALHLGGGSCASCEVRRTGDGGLRARIPDVALASAAIRTGGTLEAWSSCSSVTSLPLPLVTM